jgi:glycosyltransferase involved in cell wall biosynthesis
MKFPFIIFYRDDQYKDIDQFFITNKSSLDCSVYITNKLNKVENLYNCNNHLLITYGNDIAEYSDKLLTIVSQKMLMRHLHLEKIDDVSSFNKCVNDKYINICSLNRDQIRPTFSLFTSAFNSYHKIIRVYESLKAQTLKDWEWVIMDDSPDDKHFIFLRNHFLNDNRIRFYRHSQNNGSIGNVKNEVVSLCRGKYVLEMDHDDEILPSVLQDASDLFEAQSDVGFIYMDFICVFENGKNQWYGDFICKGYGGYYSMKYKDKWRLVYITPNINNITLSHLICCPNHPRIWRRDALLEMGNYCEYLHICDDYEILLRTAIKYKMAKIHKLGYVQYMNEDNNNFSLIRNKEINRIGPQHIHPIYYDLHKIHDKMKELDAYEDQLYIKEHSKIWLRNPEEYTHKYCNLLVNNDYDCQICIIGFDSLLYYMDQIKTLYDNPRNDFLLLENKGSNEYLWKRLENYGFDKMKCYTLPDHTNEQLINYFKLMYVSTNKYEIFDINILKLLYNTPFNNRPEIINSILLKTNTYLEIGVEYGYTFDNIHCINKKGVDPDPKCKNIENIYKYTSDNYFEKIHDPLIKYDAIFIDGMHQVEYVLRDINNSIQTLLEDGCIFIGDILPINYNEQLKIPYKHHYENGILKYGEEWTGDVWKVLYYILLNYSDKLTIKYYCNYNYRGLAYIKINEKFTILIDDNIIDEINNYDYFKDFNNYVKLLNN